MWTFSGGSPASSTDPSLSVCYNSPGVYDVSLIAYNDQGSDTAFGSIEVFDFPSLDLGSDESLCEGESVLLDASASGIPVFWSTGSQSPTISVDSSGTYWAEVDNEGCSTRDSINVQFDPFPQLELGDPQLLCEGDSIFLDASFSGATYSWNTGSFDPEILVDEPGLYVVESQIGNCVSSDSIQIDFAICNCMVEVPNAFTPDGDGRNDDWRPIHFCPFEEYELRVWNRWGQLIFETDQAEDRWDGTFKGKPQEMGNYVWVLSYKWNELGTLRNENLQGTILLIR